MNYLEVTIYREPHSLKYFRYVPDSLKQSWNSLASLLPEGTKGRSFRNMRKRNS